MSGLDTFTVLFKPAGVKTMSSSRSVNVMQHCPGSAQPQMSFTFLIMACTRALSITADPSALGPTFTCRQSVLHLGLGFGQRHARITQQRMGTLDIVGNRISPPLQSSSRRGVR